MRRNSIAYVPVPPEVREAFARVEKALGEAEKLLREARELIGTMEAYNEARKELDEQQNNRRTKKASGR